MQRIIPFGRDYAQSAEFSVDEGETIRFWLVREDYTTTPGQHAYAELQIKSASGNDHWTTIEVLTGDKPYHDLIGTEESLTYRWVRKTGAPSAAVDRSQDGDYSRQRRAPISLQQPDFEHATLPVLFKVHSGAGTADTLGVATLDAPDGFGAVLGAAPSAEIEVVYDPTVDAGYVRLESGSVDWSGYIGGVLYLFTECPAPGDTDGAGATFTQAIVAAAIPGDPQPGEAETTATTLRIELDVSGMEPLQFFEEGRTFFVALRRPGQSVPSFNLGARTGRFVLDHNDTPARLSAWPFDTTGEHVALSAVEQGGVVIPITYDEAGDPIRLQASFGVFTMIAPGEYEWERSCNSAPGVWLNTGWRA